MLLFVNFLFFSHFSLSLSFFSASAGGLDCVHIIHPQSFGTETMVAAGSRDHRIYLWKKRDVQASSSSSRSMRKYTTAELRGHKVHLYMLEMKGRGSTQTTHSLN